MDPYSGAGGPDIPAPPPAATPPAAPPGQYVPPAPPRYPAYPGPPGGASDIPPSSPYHQSGAPVRRNGSMGWLGGLGAALIAFFKYGGLFLLKVPFLLTAVTAFGSYVLYAIALGPWAALGIVLMILVHEMGHVIEIQRQGLRATAPVFIPFMGAAIFQRQHPTDAVRQAQIGIAGPIAGSVGATAAFAAFGATHFAPLAVWAWFGFWINLINLIPAGMLDGGWILAPVSKWSQVVGLALVVGLVLLQVISPVFLIFVVMGLPATLSRFRYANSSYFTSVPTGARWGLGISWLALVVYLLWASMVSQSALDQFVR